jgi:hypothetical protein
VCGCTVFKFAECITADLLVVEFLLRQWFMLILALFLQLAVSCVTSSLLTAVELGGWGSFHVVGWWGSCILNMESKTLFGRIVWSSLRWLLKAASLCM